MKRSKWKVCRCGHAQSEHTVSSGPEGNIALWVSNLCAHGGESIGPYFFTECKCYGYRLSIPRTIRTAFAAPLTTERTKQ